MSQARSHPDTLRIPKYARVAPGALMYTAQTRCLVTEAIVRVVQQKLVLEVVEKWTTSKGTPLRDTPDTRD